MAGLMLKHYGLCTLPRLALCPARSGCRPTHNRRAAATVVAAGAAIEIPREFSTVKPKGELVLCKVAEAEEKTTGGILLPVAAQRKPTSGDVVALGDGQVGEITIDFELKEGDTILYSKFGIGTTDLEVQGEDLLLIRESDVIGKLPRSGATAADVPKLQPVRDRVLVKVDRAADKTAGGIMLPDAAREKPIAGTVVRVGPGKRDKEDGMKRKDPRVAAGDKILYFKWAGDQMETPEGDQYVVLHESDILCKV